MRRLDATCVRASSLAAGGSLRAAITLVLIGFLSPTLPAAFSIWDGGGSDDNWTTNANWLDFFGGPGVAPPPNGNNDIVFPASGGLVQTPIVDVPYSINKLTFNNGNGRFVILGAAELTIGAGGITNNDADIQSVIGPVKLSANQTWNAAAGPLQMDAVNLNGFDLMFAGAYPIALPSAIVGTGDLTIANTYTSTVTMSGSSSNTYLGDTDVENGTLGLQKTGGATAVPRNLTIGGSATVRLGANEQISHAPGNYVAVNDFGVLDLNGYTETIANLSVSYFGSVTTGAGMLKIGQTLGVANSGILTGNLSLGDVTALVHSGGEITTNSNLFIGDFVNGTLNIITGGDVRNSHAYLGWRQGSTGVATVDGTGSTWTCNGGVTVGSGFFASGTLDISAGGAVSSTYGTIAWSPGSSGVVTVDGTGSTWTNSGVLTVGPIGYINDATLEITNGGTVTVGGSTSVNSVSEINVSNGTFDADGDLTIDGGSLSANSNSVVNFASGILRNGASVTVENGASLTHSATLDLESDVMMQVSSGATYAASGLVKVGTVSGPASELIVDGQDTLVSSDFAIDVGYGGTGIMTVTGGGRVETGTGAVGSFTAGSIGTVTLDGTDASGNPSTWESISGINMGLDATSQGTLSILNGGLFDTYSLTVGYTGKGTILVDGADGSGHPSLLDTQGLEIATLASATGEATVSNGGRVESANFYMASLGGIATLTVTGTGSTLVQSSTSTITIGHATNGMAKINVLNGGLIDSGTGAIMIHATGSIVLDGTAAAGTFNADGAITVRGSVQIGTSSPGAGGMLNVNAGLTVDGGSVHLSRGVLNANTIALANDGTFDFDGGTLHVDDFQNNLTNEGGTLAPGKSTGHTDITGNYTQLDAATLEIEIGGVVPGLWDTIAVTGNAILDGTIQVALLNGFQPVLGNSFTILTTTFGNVGGAFDTELFPVTGGVTFDIIYNSQSVVLQVVEATTLPGDYNNNGTVDAADYVLWRKYNNTSTTLPNDSTPGTDPSDYEVWRTHFGQPPGSGSGATANSAVPEPGTLVLLTFAAVVRCLRRCRAAKKVAATHQRVTVVNNPPN